MSSSTKSTTFSSSWRQFLVRYPVALCSILTACGPLVGADFEGFGSDVGVPDAGQLDPEAGSEAAAPIPAPSRDAGRDAASAAPICVASEATSYPTKPPAARSPGACSAADRTKIEEAAGVAGTAVPPPGVSASCKACIQSKATDPSWGPYVEGATNRPNPGPCARIAGGTTACAKALAELFVCNEAVCAPCEAAGEECPGAIATRCSAHLAKIDEECPRAIQDKCLDLAEMLLVPCE